jgi:hypothetical protein
VREAEIEIAVLHTPGTATCVPLHGIMSRECSLASAAEQVAVLMGSAEPLERVDQEADLSTRAVLCSGTAPLPREWPHVVLDEALLADVAQLQPDLCLVVAADGFVLRWAYAVAWLGLGQGLVVLQPSLKRMSRQVQLEAVRA